MVVALPSDHALARRDRGGGALSLKDLAGETFIVYARQLGPAFYEATMAACLKADSAFASVSEAPATLHRRSASSLSGSAISLAAGLHAANDDERHRIPTTSRGCLATESGPEPRIAPRRDRQPVVRNFVSLVRRTARGFPFAISGKGDAVRRSGQRPRLNPPRSSPGRAA